MRSTCPVQKWRNENERVALLYHHMPRTFTVNVSAKVVQQQAVERFCRPGGLVHAVLTRSGQFNGERLLMPYRWCYLYHHQYGYTITVTVVRMYQQPPTGRHGGRTTQTGAEQHLTQQNSITVEELVT